MLFQIADCQTYVKTLHHLELYPPQTILMPESAFGGRSDQDSLLLRSLQDEYEHVPIEPVARRCWNDAAGHDFVNQLCADDDERAAILVAIATKCADPFESRYDL